MAIATLTQIDEQEGTSAFEVVCLTENLPQVLENLEVFEDFLRKAMAQRTNLFDLPEFTTPEEIVDFLNECLEANFHDNLERFILITIDEELYAKIETCDTLEGVDPSTLRTIESDRIVFNVD